MRKKVVTIGGGSGSFNLLKGLKKYAVGHDEDEEEESIDIKFIAASTDSGGSSGKLRDEHGILPPGDMRRGLVALSDESKALRFLLEFRVNEENSSLNGHNLGNWIILGLTKYSNGDEKKAWDEAHRIFKVRGRIMPSTWEKTDIEGEYEDGNILKREHIIDKFNNPNGYNIKRLYSTKKINANPDALEAISNADAIIMGPGDLYTSIICNFLGDGVVNAIKNSKALKIYNCNIMTKPSETPNYSVADHFNDLERYLGKGVIDVVTYNNKLDFDPALIENYKHENKFPVSFKEADFAGYDGKFIGADLASKHDIIRHDSKKLSRLMIDILFP